MGNGGTLPIGPGIWGFIAFFVLAVALWFLVRNMNARLRRMAYRDREQAEADALSAPGGEEPRGDEVPHDAPSGDDDATDQRRADQNGEPRAD